jgi:amino acid permease
MPWGFGESGIVGGSVLLSIVAVLSFETARVLLVVQRVYYLSTGEAKSYPQIASKALGEVWGIAVQGATIVSCIGGCIGYLIFFGETLGQVFLVPPQSVVLVATVPVVLLSWIRVNLSFSPFPLFYPLLSPFFSRSESSLCSLCLEWWR